MEFISIGNKVGTNESCALPNIKCMHKRSHSHLFIFTKHVEHITSYSLQSTIGSGGRFMLVPCSSFIRHSLLFYHFFLFSFTFFSLFTFAICCMPFHLSVGGTAYVCYARNVLRRIAYTRCPCVCVCVQRFPCVFGWF